MIRTLMQLDERTYQRLRRRAFEEKRSMSSVVREVLAAGLDGRIGPLPRPRRRLLSVAAGRSKQPAARPVSEHHDDALAKAFES